MVSKFRARKNKDIVICKQRTFQEAYFINENLPPLPIPSPALRQLLLKFNGNSSKSRVSIKKAKSRTPKLRKKKKVINAFIAFKSFYSKCIGGIKRQRRITTLLAEIWEKDIDKQIWKRYAFEYNKSDRDDNFIDWLCKAMNIQDKQESPENFSSSLFLNDGNYHWA